MVLDATVLGIKTYPIAPRTILDISTLTLLATFRKTTLSGIHLVQQLWFCAIQLVIRM